MQQACSFYEMIVGSAMNGIERDAKRTKQEQNVRKVKILIGHKERETMELGARTPSFFDEMGSVHCELP